MFYGYVTCRVPSQGVDFWAGVKMQKYVMQNHVEEPACYRGGLFCVHTRYFRRIVADMGPVGGKRGAGNGQRAQASKRRIHKAHMYE